MSAVLVIDLAEDPLAASSQFHAEVLPEVQGAMANGVTNLTLVFAPAGHRHKAWRKAAVATLAREMAPARVNAVASADEAATAAALAWLDGAEAITGHYMPLDSAGAGKLV